MECPKAPLSANLDALLSFADQKKFGRHNFSLLGPQKDVISNIYQNKVQIRINTFVRFTQK